jgi:hypothetical protein
MMGVVGVNSTKSVVEKLNFKKYPAKLIVNKPEDIRDFEDVEFDSSIEKTRYDLIFAFVFSMDEFANQLKSVVEKQLLNDNGYIFFAYPKKNNPQYKEYIERDAIFTTLHVNEEGYVPGSSIKFSRMISLNEVFTVVGMKSEPPKKSKNTTTAKASQCVDDYIEHVEEIKQYLTKNEELAKVYNDLTPGYQKDWARYVFSAKQKETQEKRLLEMETVLGEGYKSMDLYRRKKK